MTVRYDATTTDRVRCDVNNEKHIRYVRSGHRRIAASAQGGAHFQAIATLQSQALLVWFVMAITCSVYLFIKRVGGL
jgi:hypothetical protein